MKNWFQRQWARVKKWWVGVLIALGLAVPMVQAVPVDFTYTRATEYSDGTPMPLSEIQETRLYCDGSLVATEAGADQDFNPDLNPGIYDCYATHVDTYGRESAPSNTIQKTVLPGMPNAPVLDN